MSIFPYDKRILFLITFFKLISVILEKCAFFYLRLKTRFIRYFLQCLVYSLYFRDFTKD